MRKATRMTDKTPDYPEPFPTMTLKFMPDLYMVPGTIKFKPLMNINRNMAIIKHGKELTVVNPIRLSEKGEEQLKQLGEVKRIIRLGVAHG